MRILIVEDEVRIRAFLARAFEAEGLGVDVVADGEQGLARALAGSYDLVILDLLLPGASGLDALRATLKTTALCSESMVDFSVMCGARMTS